MESSAKMYKRVIRSAAVIAGVVGRAVCLSGSDCCCAPAFVTVTAAITTPATAKVNVDIRINSPQLLASGSVTKGKLNRPHGPVQSNGTGAVQAETGERISGVVGRL